MTSTQGQGTSEKGLWKGATAGQAQEWTVIAPIKPGRAAVLRETLAAARANPGQAMELMMEMGNLHDGRQAIFENDTRLLFATTFDGDWDVYIDDWARHPSIPTLINAIFGECEGWPGLVSPEAKAWFGKYGVKADVFRSAYPDLTVQDIWKHERVNGAFQALLDDPAFRTALDNPALKPLRDLPTFQALLDAGAS